MNFVALHPGIVLRARDDEAAHGQGRVFVRNLLLPKPILNPDSAHFVDVRDVRQRTVLLWSGHLS